MVRESEEPSGKEMEDTGDCGFNDGSLERFHQISPDRICVIGVVRESGELSGTEKEDMGDLGNQGSHARSGEELMIGVFGSKAEEEEIGGGDEISQLRQILTFDRRHDPRHRLVKLLNGCCSKSRQTLQDWATQELRPRRNQDGFGTIGGQSIDGLCRGTEDRL
ncbi:unnamed protein product [Microthlaspi erraticum]|uniref:Uncharacterized protein n=1 Tax=Microthlaspi erraticum TaxID=1685480 RepID=A0A6D2KAH7_9BRAS|nr:unnamed protein product [Microthlaspi erraticum]